MSSAFSFMNQSARLPDVISVFGSDTLHFHDVELEIGHAHDLADEGEPCRWSSFQSFDGDIDIRNFRKGIPIEERAPLPNPQRREARDDYCHDVFEIATRPFESPIEFALATDFLGVEKSARAVKVDHEVLNHFKTIYGAGGANKSISAREPKKKSFADTERILSSRSQDL